MISNASAVGNFEFNFAEGDPSNYLTYFKRGTVYYALGKAKFALQDFSKVNTYISILD